MFVVVTTIASLAPLDPGRSDKAFHVIAYFLAVLPVAFGSRQFRLPLACALMAWGVVIEVVQPWVGRSGNISDAAANLVGVLLGLGVAHFFRRNTRQ